MILFAGCTGKGDHATIKDGDLVELTAVEKTEEGIVLWRSSDYDRTALVVCSPSVFKDDLFAALRKLHKGDSVAVTINLDSMVEKMGHKRPPNTKGKYIVYELVIHTVISGKQEKERFMQQRMARLKNEEAGKLVGYLRTKQLKTTVQSSGLQFAIAGAGTGAAAHTGDTVEMQYTAHLMSGKVIDTALHTPRHFIAGLRTTIAGLEEAMQILPAQTKATVVIPSSLAFGEQGYEGIQPYTPLIYELEIVRIGRFTGKRPHEPGASLPDFAVTNIANNIVVQKEDVHNGEVAFVFFSTDCDHCQHLIAAVNEKFSTFKALHWYFVSSDSTGAIRQCMQQYGPLLLNNDQVTVCRDDNRRMASVFQAAAYPSVYVYDREHRLIKHVEGETAMRGIRSNFF